MRIVLRDFAQATAEADVALIYFAGHGVEIDNTNYLIPINAELRSDRDVEFETIRLERLIDAVDPARGLKLILLDACRNNPFLSDMVRTKATRSVGRGLGGIDPSGVLVGYAARGGTVAMDGDGRNSPYAKALLDHIEQPGLEVGKMFRQVRDQVFRLTDGMQEPFVYGSLPGQDVFLVPAALPSAGGNADPGKDVSGGRRGREGSADRLLLEALELVAPSDKADALEKLGQSYPDTRSGKIAIRTAVQLRMSTKITPRETENKMAGEPSDTVSPEEREETALHLNSSYFRRLQSSLKTLGFSAGPSDGVFGARSRSALREYQAKNGFVVSGYLTHAVVDKLMIGVPKKTPDAQSPSPVASKAPAGFDGDYIVDIRRQPNPRYCCHEERSNWTRSMATLRFRKSGKKLLLLSVKDNSGQDGPHLNNVKGALTDAGQLRISVSVNFLVSKIATKNVNINQQLPDGFRTGEWLVSTAGRFDDAWNVEVAIKKSK